MNIWMDQFGFCWKDFARINIKSSLFVLLLQTTLTYQQSSNIVLLSHTPLVSDSKTTTLTCTDLSGNSSKSSLFIRRLFTWSGSSTTQSTSTSPVLNQTGMMDTWSGTNIRKSVGAFGCGRGDNSVSAVKMHVNGTLYPQAFSKIVVVGSKAVIKMNLAPGAARGLRKVTWYKDGHVMNTRHTQRMWEAEFGRALVINSVNPTDAGVYMAHHTDENKFYAAGTTLVVRHCTTTRWSQNCDQPCPFCLNGATCSEKNGACVCPPGFMGRRCERACPPSYFGSTCEKRCSGLKSGGTSCQGVQQCSTNGCACMSGWMGLGCMKACPPGRYGADCHQPCRCYHNGRCDRFRGCICTPEWTGPSCKAKVKVSSRVTSPPPTVLPETERNQDDDPTNPVVRAEEKPYITEVSANPSFMVNQGQKVEVQCSVTGVPSPQHGEIILRRKDMTEIPPTQSKMSETVTMSFFSLVMGSYPGPYWCVATTSAGITQKEFNFTIPVLPVPIKPPQLISRRATSLKIKLNSRPFHGDGPIQRSVLLLKQSEQPSFSSYEKNISNDIVLLENLRPFTNYTFRVLLYRVGGESGRGHHPGPTAVIRTDCGVPSRSPEIKNIHATNNSILFLSWRLPPAQDIKGEVLGYKIFYRALGESTSWTPVIFEYSTTSATLKNLKPLAVYSVKIRLYNCAGDSPDSTAVRVTMGRLKKPAGPVVTLVNKTSRSLGFSWSPPRNAKPYTISKYEVLFEEVGNSSPNVARVLRNVSDLEFAGNGLVPYTRYRFRVRAYNHEGPGNFSDDLVIETREEAPSKPSNFHVFSNSPTSIGLRWEKPEEPNGVIRKYLVKYSKNGKNWLEVTQGRLIGSDRELLVKNLEEYTEYWFKVQAITVEPGVWSEDIKEKTMSLGPLEVPRAIEALSRSPQSVSLSWKPPPQSGYVGDITQYKIIYTDDMRQNVEHWKAKFVPGSTRSVDIVGLRSYTVYLFAMAAVTHRAGPYSEQITVRTLRLGLPPPPTGVSVINITSHSAIVRWNVKSDYSIINVRIRVKSGSTLEWQDYLFHASKKEALIDLLDSGTMYNIELTAGNQVGESSGNPILNFKTQAADVVISEALIYQILVPVLVTVVVILVCILAYCKYRSRSNDSVGTTHMEMDSISNHIRVSTFGSSFQSGAVNSRSGTLLSSHSVHSGNSRAPSTHSGQLLLPENLIISWENILFEDIPLGEGNFGQVVKAVVQREDKLIQVAVKMLKDGCSADDRKDFLAELDMMVRIGHHSNIISLIGACEHESCLYLCTEFAPNGNLLQFLRKSRRTGADGTYTTLGQDQLLQFALDVCYGMAHLSEKQLIHRDLAARNVLLDRNMSCKVADFGLSRGEGVYVKKTVARLPIRWMAIESLNYNVYTTKSDVWSFGVLLWEIVSLGGTPYYGMSCAELYEKLPLGYRMEQPLNCDGEVYKLMSQCWQNKTYERPSFSQLCVALKRMIDARSSRNYVNTAIFENFMFATIDANEEEG